MPETLNLSANKRPPKGRYVHNIGSDVEAIYPFTYVHAKRAVRATDAERFPGHIDHEVFQARMRPVIVKIVSSLNSNFTEIAEDLPCNRCETGCGLQYRIGADHLSSTESTHLHVFIQAGVDRRNPGEPDRPDEPILNAGVRCYNALEPQTDDNYETYARAQVEKLPPGMQFDERCHLVMGEVAVALFKHFDEQLRTLEMSGSGRY